MRQRPSGAAGHERPHPQPQRFQRMRGHALRAEISPASVDVEAGDEHKVFVQHRLSEALPELDPEVGPLRHEECSGAEAEEHHHDRNALLPAHAQATFLLGMAQTSTGVTRPMMVAMVSGVAQAMLNPV